MASASWELVHLEPWELALGAKVGVARAAYAQANGLQNARGLAAARGAQVWALDVVGAMAEVAVAKRLDRYWEAYVGPPTPHRPDVGLVEVRWAGPPTGHLIVPPLGDGPYVLVTGDAPDLTIHGWLDAAEARRGDWYAEGRGPGSGAYWVPQSALRPIGELVR